MKRAVEPCLDQQLQAEIALAVAWASATGRSPELTAQARAHLEACSSCQAEISIWRDQGLSIREEQEVADLARLAEAGDSAVLTKSVTAGIAYFRADANDSSVGLLVVRERAAPHFRLATRRVSRAEFDQMV